MEGGSVLQLFGELLRLIAATPSPDGKYGGIVADIARKILKELGIDADVQYVEVYPHPIFRKTLVLRFAGSYDSFRFYVEQRGDGAVVSTLYKTIGRLHASAIGAQIVRQE